MNKAVSKAPRASNRLRKTLRSRAQIRIDSGHVIIARTIDISMVGMSLMSPQALTVGACLTVVFQIPTQGKLETIIAAATVLYHTPDGTEGFRLGIQFSEQDPLRSSLIELLL